MARSVDDTKRRLLAAATAEFSAYGPHGATMEKIAKRAGVNKERLYAYFGDKPQVFATVLAEELEKVADAVPAEVITTEGAGEFAGRCFDYLAANPNLIRLLLWEALVYGDTPVPDEARRSDHYREKVATLADFSGSPEAAHAFATVIALAHWWFVLPQVARMITGADGTDPAEYAQRRATVVEAVTRALA